MAPTRKTGRSKGRTSKSVDERLLSESINHTAVVESRIEHIAGLMRELRFVRGQTLRQLAKQWKLTEQRLRELCAEASKRVRAEVTDPERVTVDVCSSLDIAIRGALEERDWKNVVAAGKTWATIVGAVAPARLQVTDVPLEKLAPEEREKLIREAVETLQNRSAT